MSRSLKVRSECIPTVKSSLLRNGFPSQKVLAEDLGIAQSTVSNFLNGRPVDYVNFREICQILSQEWRNIADLSDTLPENEINNLKAKVFISSRHQDFRLVQQLQQALSAAGHEVAIASENTPPEQYLQSCDYLLLLLSQQSAVSEIVLEEVRVAKELHNFTAQKPAILPLCVGLQSKTPLSFDLLQLLQSSQPWQWRSDDDTSIIVSEVLSVVAQGRTSLSASSKLAVNWATEGSGNWGVGIGNWELGILPHSPTLPLPVASPELPEGQVEVASSFYIDRPPIETRCYETICQPGALIRIKAPRQMGKTSLMARILHHAEEQGSRAIALSFQLANKRILTNSDTFLQWFCASIGQELGMLEKLGKCWELADIIGSNQCCKAYFEQCLLPEISTSLTLGLDEVDRVFESPEIADDFFGLLRALHEESKRRDIWKKFRLVIVHSTEVYIPLDINKSPFNVGLPIELPEFNLPQVQELARRYGLDWNGKEVEQLMGLVGGHPYLVRLAMYCIARQDVTLDRVVEEGATEAGIYSDHLRRHLWNLEKYPDLLEAMKEVVSTSGGVRLRSELAFKLNSMGLVKLDGNDCTPRCSLYEQYFRDRLALS
ncbi:AAA-like domain-containing protein [Argonema galeatum]|uniref:AAA-like domain-containing protein n=1 Tax=Argonema galeatum TaxID=2942762 RepID=UPI0020121224|nr:AAA-like domain-containing protein [Argonema galeatum]MCL1465612.1 AAA-like domain-containing protein [Argonema galeatum A003/A1]